MKIRRVAEPGQLEFNMEMVLDWLDFNCFPEDDLYKKKGAYWWIAYDGRAPVGFAGLKPLPHQEGFLCRIGVLPVARGEGLHKRFLRARERLARQLGMKTLVTYTMLNPPSIKTLVESGYTIFNPSRKWGGDDALHFYKDL